MTLKLGALQADIEVDTSDLKKADKEIKNTANTLEREFKQGGDSASKSLEKTGKAANDSFKSIRGAAGNVGFQLQDIAVQAQAGTNALVILGQQGSQILGAFGPAGAIAGAVLAIGAAIGSALVPSLFESKVAVDELEESLEILNKTSIETEGGIAVLTKEVTELAKKSEAAAQTLIKGGIVTGLAAIEKAGEGVEKLLKDELPLSINATGQASRNNEKNIKRFAESLGITAEGVKFLQESLESIKNDKSAENIARIQEGIDKIVSGSEKASDDIIEFANSLREYSSIAEQSAERVDAYRKAQENLTESIKESEELLNSGGNGEAFQRFVDRRLSQIDQLGESERDAIERIAKERAEFVEEFDEKEGIERDIRLKKISDERLAKLKEIDKREQDQRLSQQKQALNEQNQVISQGAQAISGIFDALGNDQASRASKLISAVAQTAISLSTIYFAQSKAQGLADPAAPTLPQKIANVATLTSAFLSIFSAIKSGTGKQFGGAISPNSAYPINEAGVPEVLTQNGRDYLLPTGSGGQVKPLQASTGSSAPIVNITSTGTPQTVQSATMQNGQLSIMIKDAMNTVKNDINTSLATGRGDTARSLQSGFKLTRNLT